ncbi:hypothetical protein B0H13DRAFT_2323136 [Mycena leptocephala]|nr:hypothetical protein B0H13DRAFT_2323136 [Mycena leptocephala]
MRSVEIVVDRRVIVIDHVYWSLLEKVDPNAVALPGSSSLALCDAVARLGDAGLIPRLESQLSPDCLTSIHADACPQLRCLFPLQKPANELRLLAIRHQYLVLVGNSPPSSGVPRAIAAKCYAGLASYRPIVSALQTISKNGLAHNSQK